MFTNPVKAVEYVHTEFTLNFKHFNYDLYCSTLKKIYCLSVCLMFSFVSVFSLFIRFSHSLSLYVKVCEPEVGVFFYWELGGSSNIVFTEITVKSCSSLI